MKYQGRSLILDQVAFSIENAELTSSSSAASTAPTPPAIISRPITSYAWEDAKEFVKIIIDNKEIVDRLTSALPDSNSSFIDDEHELIDVKFGSHSIDLAIKQQKENQTYQDILKITELNDDVRRRAVNNLVCFSDYF
jgi:hypothetical protein